MNRIFSAAALAISMILSAPGASWAENDQRQISVTGRGSVATTPDMATINLGVTNRAKEAAQAMAATSEATGKMLQRLADLGVAPSDLQTSSLSLHPIWPENRPTEKAPSLGFVASNSVTVRVRDLTVLGRLLDAVIADGSNDFNGLQFSVQDPDPLMNQARQNAVADATAKALLLTMAAGVNLGPVLSISENGGGRPMVMEMPSARSNSVPIAVGEVTVNATVSMIFAIKD
jgi:uncharacterized protein YggE